MRASGHEARRAAVLAVDGGNSKTDVVIVAADGSVLTSVHGPGFRPHETGQAAALEALADTVNRAARQLTGGAPADTPWVEHVSAFLANADLPVEEQAFRDDLERRGWSRTVRVGNDTLALLRAGSRRSWGVAVVCGAGINCVGVAPDGRTARFPSIGRISGDWGGGTGLGEEALWHAVRAEDGRGPATSLVRVVASHFGTRSVEEVTLGLHFGEISPERLSDLVPAVFAAADEGDAVAVSLVERLADEVTVMAVVAMRRLDILGVVVEVVLGGGILAARPPLLMSGLERRFAAQAPKAELSVVTAPPVLGAALLGLDELRSRGAGVASDAETRLRSQLGEVVRRDPTAPAATA